MMQKFVEKTILIVPLDWGLGHAARCIPIIQQFQSYQFNVLIAAEGPVKTLLKQEFPGITILPLQGYNVRYSTSKRFFNLTLLLQLPRIIRQVLKEQHWLKKVVREHNISAIISDNRFGLFHQQIPAVYITHQLQIKAGNALSSTIASRIHRYIIKKYRQCWVPDFEGLPNAAGALSHPSFMPPHVHYLGCISRFDKLPMQKQYQQLILLSGPEPQRTLLEHILLQQLTSVDGQTLFVRGLPDVTTQLKTILPPQVTVLNHLPAAALSQAIQQAEMVICRSGYTTVMDLLQLQQKAILIPTPGQAEQEYLAAYLMEQQLFYATEQSGFDLRKSLAAASRFNFAQPAFDMQQYKKVIQQFVETL